MLQPSEYQYLGSAWADHHRRQVLTTDERHKCFPSLLCEALVRDLRARTRLGPLWYAGDPQR